jgi:hypothetical protein
LHDQVHHDVHDADMNKHVRHEAPRFIAFSRVVNEELCHRSACTRADALDVVVGVVTESLMMRAVSVGILGAIIE